MERKVFLKQLKNIFKNSIYVKENIIFCENLSINNLENQQQTNKIFSDKWTEADDYKNIDALDTKFQDSSFNYVIAAHVLHHIPYPLKFFKEMHRILKKDGKLLIHEANLSVLLQFIFF